MLEILGWSEIADREHGMQKKRTREELGKKYHYIWKRKKRWGWSEK